MLNNRFAGSVLSYLNEFKENGIQMNGQIVLVPGYNDENELVKTLDDLKAYFPVLQSISVVPVGISKFREGLPDLKAFDQEQAKKTLEIINNVQMQMRKNYGLGFVYPSDEFFKLAKIPLPGIDYYDDFLQIENGVGMVADFKHEFLEKLETQSFSQHNKRIGLLTGYAALDEMQDLIFQLKQKYTSIEIEVLPIKNNFFGEKITVSGLMTGKDIIEQVKPILEQSKFDYLLIPENALKKDTELMLDDLDLKALGKILDLPVIKTKVNGGELLETIFQQ
jgi:NifB/MoaA-like Fe-S oxidoreductase